MFECDREASKMGQTWPTGGVVVPRKKERKIYGLLFLRCMKISQWCNFIVKDQAKKWKKERPQYSSTKFAASVEK